MTGPIWERHDGNMKTERHSLGLQVRARFQEKEVLLRVIPGIVSVRSCLCLSAEQVRDVRT